jgi:NAD(P)H-nitrite reductase large subunit
MSQTQLRSVAITPGVGQVHFSPAQLAAIGAAAGAEGRVELNSFMQLILHSDRPDLEEALAELQALGMGVYPVGRVVKNLHTCTFCMGENVAGLPDAERLDAVVAGVPVPFTVRIGFSGCDKNCGEAKMREIGLVREQDGRYSLYLGGKTGGDPVIAALAAEGIRGEELPAVVERVLETYRSNARGKERLWKLVQRIGLEPFQAAIGQ